MTDSDGRTPNNLTAPEANNSFFILGSKDQLPQEQHRANFRDTKKAKELSNLREELSNINLLPSQTGKQDTPPIVLLTTGDIIIQKPEDYKADVLNNITLSADRKVILVTDKEEELIRAGMDYPEAFVSKNIGIVYNGKVFFNDVKVQKPKKINQDVFVDRIENPSTSVDQEVGLQLQHLKALQQFLIKENFIKPDKEIFKEDSFLQTKKNEKKSNTPLTTKLKQNPTNFKKRLLELRKIIAKKLLSIVKFLPITLFGIAKVVIKSIIYSAIQLSLLAVSAIKFIRKKGILQATKILAKAVLSGIKRIGKEIVTFGKNVKELPSLIAILIEKTPKDIKKILADIQVTSDLTPPVDGRIQKGVTVSTKTQHDFTKNLFETVKERFLKIDALDFKKDGTKWLSSASKRSRLVVVETENQKVGDLADLIFDGTSLDRVVLVGLKKKQSKVLKIELIDKYLGRFSDKKINKLKKAKKESTSYNIYNNPLPALLSKRKRKDNEIIDVTTLELKRINANRLDFIKSFAKNSDEEKNFEDVLKGCSLKELMGPHMYQESSDLNFDKIKKWDNNFHVNIEEVFCYGLNNKLAKDALVLSRKIDVPVFSLRSEAFESCHKDDKGLQDQGAWTGAVKSKDFVKKITAGLTTKDFFEKREENSDAYKDIKISKNFKELFDLDSVRELMKSDKGYYRAIDKNKIDLLNEDDIDYFKEIFLSQGSYASATPLGISRTISSAASQLAAKKAEGVATSLKYNAINVPTSSAIEVQFTGGTISLDVGGDIIKEELDKGNSYRLMYQNMLGKIVTEYPEIDMQEALKIAFTQTVSAYIDIEKSSRMINELERGKLGANQWREFGVKEMNKIIDCNNKAIEIFSKGGYIFGAQLSLQFSSAIHPALGALAFGASGANIVPWSMNAAAAASGLQGLNVQIQALRDHTTNTNTAFSAASSMMYDAQQERALLVDIAVSRFNNHLDTHKINKGEAELDLSELNCKQTCDVSLYKSKDYSDEYDDKHEGQMIYEIKQITEKENSTGLVDLPSGCLYTEKVQEEHVNTMLYIQAGRSKEISEIMYNKNIISWAQSASARARLVIIEPNISNSGDNNIIKLAKIAFNASPLERVLITGLDDTKKREDLENALKDLWKKKLKGVASDNENGTPEKSANIEQNIKFFLNHFSQPGKNTTVEELLDKLTLEELLGPHLYKTDNDISFKSMNKDFRFFDVTVEEILLVGNRNELITNLADLSQNCKNKPASFSVKSQEIMPGDELWKCHALKPADFIENVAKGLGPKDIIGLKEDSSNETVTKTYENIKISPIFEKLFDIAFIEEILGKKPTGEHKISQKDLDYFKEIMFDECLYSADTSPLALPKTMSKASSILLALATRNISNHLYPNMIGYARNAILEVVYANVSSTMDAGTDMIKERIDKKNQYKGLFDNLLNIAIHGKTKEVEDKPNMEENICSSFLKTLECYNNNENRNKDIQEVINGAKGSTKHREASLFHLNKSESAAKIAGTILQVQIPLQAAAYGVGIAGSIISGGILAPVFIAAVSLSGSSILTKLASMQLLARANGKQIPNVNQTSGLANAKNYEAKQLRKTAIENFSKVKSLNSSSLEEKEQLEKIIKKELDESFTLDNGVTNNKSPMIGLGTPSNKSILSKRPISGAKKKNHVSERIAI